LQSAAKILPITPAEEIKVGSNFFEITQDYIDAIF